MDDRVVVDASVAAKWFLDDEHDTDKARGILQRCLADELALHAPPLLYYETLEVLRKKCNSRRPDGGRILDKDDAIQAVEMLFAISIVVHETLDESHAKDILNLAVDFSKAFYDTSYLRLAVELDCCYLTADEKFCEAVPKDFPLDHVQLLSKIEASQ